MTTILAPAVTISIAILLIVAITLRPRLRRSAIYAVPDELRGVNIKELIAMLLITPFILSISILVVYLSPSLPESAPTDIGSILLMYIISSLGGFYLSFHRGLFAYYFILIGFFINIFLLINVAKSPLASLSFIIYFYTGCLFYTAHLGYHSSFILQLVHGLLSFHLHNCGIHLIRYELWTYNAMEPSIANTGYST